MLLLRALAATLLAAALAPAVRADTISIPAQGAAGRCSPSPTTQATFRATIDAPGVKGVYLLPQDDFDKLLNASKAATPQNVQFQYFIQFSCATGNVTSCSKNTGTTVLPNNVTCVAFVNEANATMSADLVVDFNSNQALAASGAERMAVGVAGVVAASMAAVTSMLW